MKLLVKCLPVALICALVGVLWHQLFYAHPYEIPSPLLSRPVPTFELTTLHGPFTTFNNKDLEGKLKLLVYWATWCSACREEHPILMKISERYQIPMYSIIYKDEPAAAKDWLAKHGNPYRKVGDDNKGDVAIDFGVYGTPEIYVISEGKIVYKQIGAIDEATWQDTLLPIINQYR